MKENSSLRRQRPQIRILPGAPETDGNPGVSGPKNRKAQGWCAEPCRNKPNDSENFGTFSVQHVPHPFFHLLSGFKGERRREAFLARVESSSPDACWEWQGHKNGKGYGRVKFGQQSVMAHRVAWAIAMERDPGELIVRHKCDNPPCCNPSHLHVGTHADNRAEAVARGRVRNGRLSGFSNPRVRIAPEHLERIISGLRRGLNNKQIAEGLPVGHSMISKIRTGVSFKAEAAALGWPTAPAGGA